MSGQTPYIIGILILVITTLAILLNFKRPKPWRSKATTFTPPPVKPVADEGKKAVEVIFKEHTDEVDKAATSDTPASDIADLANRRRT